MVKRKSVCWVSLLAVVAVLLCCCFTTGCTKEPIRCYIDYINPETGESLAYKGTLSYKEVHFAYDGTERTLVPVVKSYDTDQRVNALQSYTTQITWVDTELDKYEYNLPYMSKKGLYRFKIINLEYDATKYDIVDAGTPVFVYVE